jgi:DNA-binding MarR family transcriptional regulator
MSETEKVEKFNQSLQNIIGLLHIDQPEQYSEVLRGFRIMDLHVLAMLAENPGIKLTEICFRLDIPNSTLTSIIDRLEKKNLIIRVLNTSDRRSFGFEITGEGEQIVVEHNRVHALIAARILSFLNETEKESLFKIFIKVENEIRKEEQIK